MSVVADAATTTATPSLLVEHRPWWRSRVTLTAAIVGVMLVCYFALKAEYPWPASLDVELAPDLPRTTSRPGSSTSATPRARASSSARSTASPTSSTDLVSWFTSFLGWMTWVGVTVAGVLVSLRFGGVRAAIWALAAFVVVRRERALGREHADPRADARRGRPLAPGRDPARRPRAGSPTGSSARVTPVLDAMQIIPAFAYLMPIVILFSVGPGAAVITTMIYAIPPAIRITALGIRGVPDEHRRGGASRWARRRRRCSRKVRLPLARRMLLLSVNQTILFALSMVVIAGLIGGKGLGDVVTSGLNSYPALALLAGIVIVVMAMALDRVTEAVAERTNPARRHLTDDLRRRLRLASDRDRGRGRRGRRGRAARSASAPTTRARPRATGCSRGSSRCSTTSRTRTRSCSRSRAGSATTSSSTGSCPFRNFLVETPWPVTLRRDHADRARGQRAALGDHDVPDARADRRDRRVGAPRWTRPRRCSSRPCSTVVDRLRPRGLGGGEPRRSRRILRPVNDVLQTLPQLVYLIPLIYLMPVSVVPGVIAGVLYAFPVVARLVESGVRNVEANTVEAAESFGATRQPGPARRSRSRSPRTRSCSASTRGSSWCSPSS